MASTPERKEKYIQEKSEEFEVPEALEDTGMKAVETAFKATVKDGKKPLIKSASTDDVVVKIPKTQQVLEDQAKGDSSDSSTGFAVFWIRMIKKAIHFGKKIIVGEKE